MGSDFVVESKGHCFLCLNQIKSTVKQEEPEANTSCHVSVQSLSRYLKLEMRKVFIDGELIPQHLADQVEKSRLKVQLCHSCEDLNRTFAKLSRLLEKIELDMVSSLELIHQKLINAEEDGKTQRILRSLKDNLNVERDEWTDKLRILDVIRNDAIQKCSQKLRTSLPRVPTLNMTSAKVAKEKAKLKPRRRKKNPLLQVGHCSSAPHPSQPSSIEAVKMENSVLDDDTGQTNYGQDDWDMEEDDFTKEDVSTASEDQSPAYDNNEKTLELEATPTVDNRNDFCTEITPSGLPPQEAIPVSHKDPKTGKYKCSLCSNEFAGDQGLKYHYKNVHLKIKYKCNLCEKTFTRKDSCLSHYRAVHMGVAFKCKSCERIFADKSNLRKHIKTCRMGMDPR